MHYHPERQVLGGVKEIVVRQYGEKQVEIIIPEVDQREVDQIKKGISTAGVLQFRIVANTRDHSDIIASAEAMANDPVKKRSRVVRDESNEAIGMWAGVAREETGDQDAPFKVDVSGFDTGPALLDAEPVVVAGQVRGQHQTVFA